MSYLACSIVLLVCCILFYSTDKSIHSNLFCPLLFHPISSLSFHVIPPLPLHSLSCTVLLSFVLTVRTFTTLHPGLYGLSIEQNAANPTEIPVDPASVYEEDDVFLTALRNADLTMYSYGAPRTGSPAFTKVLYIFSFYVLLDYFRLFRYCFIFIFCWHFCFRFLFHIILID